jgi:hypothetical protein
MLANADDILRDLVGTVISLGTDFFSFVILAGVLAAYGFYTGRDRLVALTLALYPALLVHSTLPESWFASFGGGPWISIGLFAALAIAANMAIVGVVNGVGGSSFPDILGLIVIAGACAGLLIAIALYSLPVQQVFAFNDATLALFTSQVALFWWYLAPLVAVFFFARS